ncbi:MAG TPA: DUF4156 domain-containing protein [Polyangiaceae bacterium]|nr:DUF4156 domain-containing protein [Polyangiaceae bacterium]
MLHRPWPPPRALRTVVCASLFGLAAGTLAACAEELPSHVELATGADNVEFAVEAPSKDGYRLVGTVKGIAAANDLDTATEAARNDLRNKAAALGATLVTVDQNVGEPMPLQNKTKVRLVGRAYKPVDSMPDTMGPDIELPDAGSFAIPAVDAAPDAPKVLAAPDASTPEIPSAD